MEWSLARLDTPESYPIDWIQATVPGAVQLDWAKAHGLPDYQIGDNVKQWAKLDEYHWVYRATATAAPKLLPNQSLFLTLEGVDYACAVFVNKRKVCEQEGCYTPVCIDIGEFSGSTLDIRIHIFPAPKSKPDLERGREQADQSCKPAVSYGWDFHPRLIPLGLWREAYLEIRPRAHFVSRPEVRYQLNADCSQARGELIVSLSLPSAEPLELGWNLIEPNGKTRLSKSVVIEPGTRHFAIQFTLVLSPGDLWWPHDQGAPSLHVSSVELSSQATGERLDSDSRAVGFRRIALVMQPGEWAEPSTFPKSRSRPPITLEINGRPIFAKGSNWVCPDVFPGRLTDQRYRELLDLAYSANFNLLRIWGGAHAPGDCFYERCDELGIMVWQEFPLACNRYPDDDAYLAALDQESRSLILRLRSFASLALWCGGNELFNAWSGMTDQALPLRLLNRNCYELDRRRPFIPTAPIEGMGHGHYVFFDALRGEEAWASFQRSSCTAYSEFGCPSPASAATLRRILPQSEIWPPRPGTSWETHHAFASWQADSWLHLPDIERYFGPCPTLEELVQRGQLLQSVGYQGLFEEARRQKPTASMALNWCFTEPWTCAANNSLITWPSEPKPALHSVGRSCRTTLASVRIRKFSWSPGELFDPELWLLHDGPRSCPSAQIRLYLALDNKRILLLTWECGAIAPNTNIRGPRAHFVLPEWEDTLFRLFAEVDGHTPWNSDYTLIKARNGGGSDEYRPTTNF